MFLFVKMVTPMMRLFSSQNLTTLSSLLERLPTPCFPMTLYLSLLLHPTLALRSPSKGKMPSHGTSSTVILRVVEIILVHLLLLLSTPLHQRAASRVQHSNHVAANRLSPQVARKGSTLSGFVQRSRLEREVGRDLHSNKWEEV